MKRRRPPKVLQLNRVVAVIILVFTFGSVAALFAGYVDLHKLQSFDQRRAYDVCVGANQQIATVAQQLVKQTPPPPNATPIEIATAEARNKRVEEQRSELDRIVLEARNECKNLLTTPQ